MSISLIGLMVFLTLTSALGAVFLIVRDIAASRRGGTDQADSEAESGPLHLQRLPRTSDDQPPSGAIGARTTAFKTVRIDEVALQRHDITMETFDLSGVFARMHTIHTTDQAYRAKADA